MNKLTALWLTIVAVTCFFSAVGPAHATDIGSPGVLTTISHTLTISDDSELVGDVKCTTDVGTACIQFFADDITLKLNGFTITGQADLITGCGPLSVGAATLESGIDTNGHSRLQILGPGLVQNFRGVGVIVRGGSTKVKVSHITTSGDCVCGILLTGSGSDDNEVEDNVAVRIGKYNGSCGGINITTNNNRVRRNIVGDCPGEYQWVPTDRER